MPSTASTDSGRDDSSTWPHDSGPRKVLMDAELSRTYGFSPDVHDERVAVQANDGVEERVEKRHCRVCFGW